MLNWLGLLTYQDVCLDFGYEITDLKDIDLQGFWYSLKQIFPGFVNCGYGYLKIQINKVSINLNPH